jgi:hypothetical protein
MRFSARPAQSGRLSTLVLLCALAVACNASYTPPPAAPSTTVAVMVQYRGAVLEPVAGTGVSLRAYAVDGDGAYTDVTSAATWTSSNSLILRAATGGSYGAVGAGTADAIAIYRGVSGSVTIPVKDQRTAAFPNLQLALPIDALSVGDSLDQRVFFSLGPGGQIDVSTAAALSSSDPQVVALAANRLTAVSPGNTQITVSYSGLTTWYRLSVAPRSR